MLNKAAEISLVLIAISLVFAAVAYGANQVSVSVTVEGWYRVEEDKEKNELKIWTNYPSIILNEQKIK